MAQETLNRIKETELTARQAVDDAKDQADAIIKEAKEKARKYEEDLLEKYRSDARAKLKQVESGMDKALETANERAQAVIFQLEKSFEDKKEAAVKMVIDYIC